MENWNNAAVKRYQEDREIVLHDCRVTALYREGKDLVFGFSDGFWLSQESSRNPVHKAVRTGPSQLRFIRFEWDDGVCFPEIRLFRRRILSYQKELTLERLERNINCGRWELELLGEYHAWPYVLFTGWLWQDKAYYQACQLELSCDEAAYFWNELRPDCTW